LTSEKNKWLIMAGVSIGTFMAVVDGSIVNIALPAIEKDLHTSFSTVQWVVLAYMLTLVTFLLTIGRLGDMFGKKRLYLAGYAIFTLGSLLCGISPSIGFLIFSRVIQALGSVMMMALGTAIITEAFPPSERGKALGLSGLIVSIGGISGPSLGGLLLSISTWHIIFFVNLPIGLIGLLLGQRFIPAHRPPGGQRFDLPGAFTMFASLFSLLIGLTFGQNQGFSKPLPLALIASFVIFLVIFVIIERRSAHPMVDLSMFSNRLFSVNLITGFLTFIGSAGLVLLMPFYLQNVLTLSPGLSGLMLTTVPIFMGIVAPISGALSDRLGSRPLTVAGLGMLVLAYLSASTLSVNTSILGYILRFIPVGIGMGLFQSPNNSAIMGAAPRERLGVASGMLSITRTLGQTSGIAIMGALWASRVSTLSGLPAGDATNAPGIYQVTALHFTLYIVIGMLSLGLLLSIIAYWQERRARVTGPVSVK
jgi:EmrB/QacA subfamily drug resistance transporter